MNSEWQIDETGRYYRMIGKNCKEYAMEYTFARPGRGNKEREAQESKEAQKREARRHTGRNCPFKNGLNGECLTECAFYGNAACVFSMTETPPNKDTSGKACPIYRKNCSEECALYYNGCGLVKIVRA